MGKHIKQLVILTISLCFLMCAGRGKKLAEPDLSHRILGKWNWVESFGGFAGERPRSGRAMGRSHLSKKRIDRHNATRYFEGVEKIMAKTGAFDLHKGSAPRRVWVRL